MGFEFAGLSHLQPDSKPVLARDKLEAHQPSLSRSQGIHFYGINHHLQ